MCGGEKEQLFFLLKKMHFNDLPFDCVRLVFDHFSLQSLLGLRAVCHQWSDWIEDGICSGKSSLKLFGSFNDIFNYCHYLSEHELLSRCDDHKHDHDEDEDTKFGDDDFALKPIGARDDDLLLRDPKSLHDDTRIEPFLLRCFPRITRFVFYYDGWPEQIELCRLLGGHTWSQTLTSLTIIGMPYLPEQQQPIWRAMAGLQSLTRLHLFHITDPFPADMATILSRLERFSLVDYRHDIGQVLRKLGPSIRHLVLEGITCTAAQFDTILAENRNLARNITKLTLDNVFFDDKWKTQINLQILASICRSFVKLKTFFPKFATNVPLQDQISELIHLPALISLRLEILPLQFRLQINQKQVFERLRYAKSLRLLHLQYVLLDTEPIRLREISRFTLPSRLENIRCVHLSFKYDEAYLEAKFRELSSNILNDPPQYRIKIYKYLIAPLTGRHRENMRNYDEPY